MAASNHMMLILEILSNSNGLRWMRKERIPRFTLMAFLTSRLLARRLPHFGTIVAISNVVISNVAVSKREGLENECLIGKYVRRRENLFRHWIDGHTVDFRKAVR